MASGSMKVGGVGCILSMVSMLMMIVFYLLVFMSSWYYGIPSWVPVMSIATAVLATVGIILIFIGALGFWKQYKSSFSLAMGIIGMVAAILWLASSVLGSTLYGSYGYSQASLILGVVVFELFGVFWILFGVAFILLRNKTGYYGLSMATGIMGIIAGAFFCSIILALIVAEALLVPTLICGMIIFFKGQ